MDFEQLDMPQFLDRVRRRLGGEVEEADILGSIDYLAHFIPAFDAKPTGAQLPPNLVRRLSDDDDLRGSLDLDAAPGELADQISLPPGKALELLETVCWTIDDVLVGDQRTHFRRNLPDELVASFERASSTQRLPVVHPWDLAAGRPGSTNPVAEADPAQDDSIAREDDPHHDRKLSEWKGPSR